MAFSIFAFHFLYCRKEITHPKAAKKDRKRSPAKSRTNARMNSNRAAFAHV